MGNFPWVYGTGSCIFCSSEACELTTPVTHCCHRRSHPGYSYDNLKLDGEKLAVQILELLPRDGTNLRGGNPNTDAQVRALLLLLAAARVTVCAPPAVAAAVWAAVGKGA